MTTRIAIAVDSNIADKLLADPDTASLLVALVPAGQASVSRTHIQADEVRATPESVDGRRDKLLRAVVAAGSEQQPTAVFLLGVSKLCASCVSSDETAALYGVLASGRASHINDAIIATTAAVRQEFLVTADRRLRCRAIYQRIDCWSFVDLHKFVRSTTAVERKGQSVRAQ